MASPDEVLDNVATVLDMVGGSMQGVMELAPAGDDESDDDGDDSDSSSIHNNDRECSSVAAACKRAAKCGFSAKEREVLAMCRKVLQRVCVRDVTWPVGLTDNRK